ncbi:MAG: RNA 2',3'-cyclic phosphodiesterase [Gammaproteobacteria bacterium]|nr:RNA 2',3'-cyclic phosphodiesterase [Gammaproteobacteria bacterium]
MTRPPPNPPDPADSDPRDRPQRLFFALWPDGALRQRLADCGRPLLQAVQGRPVAMENLHITLVFLGDVDAQQQACLEGQATTFAEGLACPPFELRLDQFGHWPRPRVLWLGAGETPAPLSLLVEQLSTGSRECGLSPETRPYRPHLTLMRKVTRVPVGLLEAPFAPLSWPVSGFVLVRSVARPPGVTYEVLREWSLRRDY